MKKNNLFAKLFLLFVASITLAFCWQKQSQAQPSELLKKAGTAICKIFCNKNTQFTGETTQPNPSNPSNTNNLKSIFIDNKTGKKLAVRVVLHINGKLTLYPDKNLSWVVEPNQKNLLMQIDKNKLTDSDIWLNVSNGKDKIWDNSSKYFITPTLEDEQSPRYFIEPLGIKPDFTYTIVEKIPPKQPWVFPIFP